MPRRLPPGEGKRYPLNLRTTRALRDRLERACAASGRSLAQEVEMRLELSFNVPEPPDDEALLRRVRTEVHLAATEAFKSALPTLRDLAQPAGVTGVRSKDGKWVYV